MSRKFRRRSGGRKTRRVSQTRRRLIYEYWDGTRQVKADPVKLLRDIQSFPDLDLERDIQLIQATIAVDNPKFRADQARSLDRLLKAIRQTFNVKPFAEVNGKAEGLTDTECGELLSGFAQWWDEIKKKQENLPTSLTPMASPVGDLPTPSGADSGGTGTESKPAEPCPSLLESGSPSTETCSANGLTP